MAEDRSDRRLLVPALGAAVLAISSAGPVVRLAQPLEPGVIAAVRVMLTGLVLAALSPSSTREAITKCLRDRALLGRVVLAALMLGLHFGTWITSLTMTTVVRSVALVSTQPIFAGFLGRMLGDRAPPRLYLGALVAIGGTVVMTLEAAVGPAGNMGLIGDMLALCGAITAAIYLAVGRSVSDRIPLTGYFVLVNLLAGSFLALYAVAIGVDWNAPAATQNDWLAVLYLGLVPGIIGHGLMNWAVRRVPVHVVSLAVLLEPVGAGVIAWVALGEGVSALEAMGAAILVGGVALGLPRRESEERDGVQ